MHQPDSRRAARPGRLRLADGRRPRADLCGGDSIFPGPPSVRYSTAHRHGTMAPCRTSTPAHQRTSAQCTSMHKSIRQHSTTQDKTAPLNSCGAIEPAETHPPGLSWFVQFSTALLRRWGVLAVGETVILLTPPLHLYRNTTEGGGGCSRLTVSPTARCGWLLRGRPVWLHRANALVRLPTASMCKHVLYKCLSQRTAPN